MPGNGTTYLDLRILASTLRIRNHGLRLAINTTLGILDQIGLARLSAVHLDGFDLGNAMHEAFLGHVDAFCWRC